MSHFLAYKKLILLFILGLFLVLAFTGEHSLPRIYALKKQRDQIKENVLQLVEENKSLHQEIQRLQHDEEPVSRIAREELGLVKPGEIIYRYFRIKH